SLCVQNLGFDLLGAVEITAALEDEF
ncbi:unnamed protein product, partial [Rotaria sp. Silwood1]